MYGRCSGGYGRGGSSSGYGTSSGVSSSYGSIGISTIYSSSPSSMYSRAPSTYNGGGATNYKNFADSYGISAGRATSHASYDHARPLEVLLEDVKPMKAAKAYMSGKDKLQLYLTNRKKYASSTAFLSPDRPETPIIQEQSEIMHYVKETFEKLTGKPFPEDKIRLHVLDDKEFEKAHGPGGRFGPGIMGFALNKQGRGIDEIFARKTHLDRMLLTIGHEIGHVMSPSLPDARDEEAKAFAFSVAWMETIRKHNIAGIGRSVLPNPARNGLHDVALDYLYELIEKGNGALQLFKDLASGALSITKRLEVIYA